MRIKIPKLLLIVILFSLFFRLIWLGVVPTGVSNDELDYILNAKALFLTGSDIGNTWNPLSLTPPKSSFPQAEIPPLVTFLLIGILPLSLFTSKLIYVLIGVGTVIVIYLIAKRLFGEKEAFIVGLVSSINPWLLFFSRTAYDTPLSIFGYLLSLYILITVKGWKLLLAFPILSITFYSYIGAKLIYLPFLLITMFYSWAVLNKRKYTKQYLVLLFLCLLPLLCYSYMLFHSGVSRIGELSNPNVPSIIETTNRERKLSVATSITPIFSNKFIVFAKHSIQKYANAFSPNFLFINGDSKSLFTVWEHGVFYYTDALFLIVGLCGLYLRRKKIWFFVLALITISPLPSVFSNVGVSYAIRSQLLAPLLILLIGLGIFYLIVGVSKKYRLVVTMLICITYFFQLLNFENIYFLRNPIYNSESFNFSTRVLSRYLFLQNGRETFVINGDPKSPLKHFLFYANLYDKNMAPTIANMYKAKKFNLNNIHFITCDEAVNLPSTSPIIFENGSKCKNVSESNHSLSITYLSDGGIIYSILNDAICSRYRLSRYPYKIKFSELNIEKLSEKHFCEKFIIDNTST